MFWLEPGPLSATTVNIVYLFRPQIKHCKIIAGMSSPSHHRTLINPSSKDQIKRHTRESQKHTYTVLLVPRVSTLASRIFEEEGVFGDVTIMPYNLQFMPLAEDVISLENDSAFKELWVVSEILDGNTFVQRCGCRTVMKRSSTTQRKLS
jgi:hypothetical protein